MHLSTNAHKTYRFCTDFQKVNSLTKVDSYPLEDYIEWVGYLKYVSKFNMLNGYWQVPLSERAKEIRIGICNWMA